MQTKTKSRINIQQIKLNFFCENIFSLQKHLI